MNRILTTIFFVLVIGYTCSAQVIIEALPRWMFGVHLNYNFPQKPVSRLLDDGSTGYQVEFQYRVQYNKPFLAGGYYNEFTLSRHEIEYTQASGAGDINISEKANTRRIEMGLTAGFYPEINWLIQPYLQGRIGMAIFQSSSILKDSDTDENIERISEKTTIAPAYGLDIGFHVVPNIWYLRGDVRVGFTGNTSTSFLLLDEENAGTSGIPIDYFENHTSAGNWLKISAGISYMF